MRKLSTGHKKLLKLDRSFVAQWRFPTPNNLAAPNNLVRRFLDKGLMLFWSIKC